MVQSKSFRGIWSYHSSGYEVAVFWDMKAWSLTEIKLSFGAISIFSTSPRNMGEFLSYYKKSHPGRQQFPGIFPPEFQPPQWNKNIPPNYAKAWYGRSNHCSVRKYVQEWHQQSRRSYLTDTTSRPTLGPIHSLIQWNPQVLPGIRAATA